KSREQETQWTGPVGHPADTVRPPAAGSGRNGITLSDVTVTPPPGPAARNRQGPNKRAGPSDSGLSSSQRSQKIARAKWDFLFGDQTEDRCCSKAADVSSTLLPPSGSPSPTSPPSLSLSPVHQKRGRSRQGQRSSHHQVHQIEVELVTPLPRGPTPKTGIIRRSLKYSETDLDAVPLRCYRETDLDEVMRAEAEAAEEANSAFGSNRTVSENSCSPENTSPTAQTDGGRQENGEKRKEDDEDDDDDDEEEEEEEGVVSWASVRMLGDMQRQRATKEEDEVFSLLLKGPPLTERKQ
ncbi:PH and SEC7 domain-containing protein 1, partial [Austrofundulus limnaeus]|uniref:PH and SEC7 domain-containing protein 1 n=1 Tax=Austrofundulus limnaeus TaxID=52670 RepID=A0A2I4CL74_AUSLI